MNECLKPGCANRASKGDAYCPVHTQVKKRRFVGPIVAEGIRARKVEVRDHALDAIRRADAFTVIAVIDGEPRTFRFAETMDQIHVMTHAFRRFRKSVDAMLEEW